MDDDPETKINPEIESDVSITKDSEMNTIQEGSTSTMSDNSTNLPSNEEISSGNAQQQHRAKAFILNTENNDWEEMATGICSPEPSEVRIWRIFIRNSTLRFTLSTSTFLYYRTAKCSLLD